MLIALLITGVAVGSIYALLGLSLVLVNKATDAINFAQGEMAMFMAFVALSISTRLHLALPLVFLLALPCGFVLGAVVERFCIRPLKGGSHLRLLIVTIGLWFIFNTAAGLIWGYDPYRFPSLLSPDPVQLLGAAVAPNNLAIIAVAVLVMGMLYLFFEHTHEGTAMRAASMNPKSARLMGIGASRVSLISWGMAGSLGMISAMLIAPVTFLDQQMMASVILKAFAGAILGGFASLPGAAAGGLLLGVVETLAGAYVSNAFKDALAFVLIIFVLMIRPAGLFGRAAIRKV